MSVAVLSRLLEAVAKSIKHATAISTILATEIFQARRDAALATSKLLLENSCYELRNAPVSTQTMFGNKIKESCQGQLRSATTEVLGIFLKQCKLTTTKDDFFSSYFIQET